MTDAPARQIEENTLGTPIGRAKPGRAGRRSAPQRPPRAASRIADENAGSLGAGFLGLASTTFAVLLATYGVIRFALQYDAYAAPLAAAGAWLLWAVVLVGVALLLRRGNGVLPDWAFAAVLVGLVGVVALDAAAVWSTGDPGRLLTAAPAAGLALLALVGTRSWAEIAVAATVLGLVLVALLAVNAALVAQVDADDPSGAFARRAGLVLLGVAPPLFASLVLRRFLTTVRLELDRVLVQSTVSAPRYAVGMLASEQLARLDLSAERLLEDVSSGRSSLPLTPATAQAAASLATELRLHLIEGRRETWLYHAISESEVLGRFVTLRDPSSLAGLLDPRQRDGVLSLAWLLVGADRRGRRSSTEFGVTIAFGAATPTAPRKGRSALIVPVSIETVGVPRGRVDPGTWDAIRKVGRHTDSYRDGSLHVEIETVVDSPAES